MSRLRFLAPLVVIVLLAAIVLGCNEADEPAAAGDRRQPRGGDQTAAARSTATWPWCPAC